LHAEVASHLQLRRNLVCLVAGDELGDCLGHDHDLDDGAAIAPLGALDQDLGNHGQQALRQEGLGLFALFGRQGVDQPVDGLYGAGGVQRAQDQVSGFGGCHRHANGLGVTQFAHQDHVRILAHRRAHALGETRDVRAELALNDLAGLAAMNEFDRILQADDVETPALVKQIDHRRERRRLAGAGGSGHEDHALMVIAQFGYDRRQPQLSEVRDVGRNGAKGRPQAGILAIHVDTEAAAVGRDIGEVQIVADSEMVRLVGRQDLHDVAFELGVAQIAELDGFEIAMLAHHRRYADSQMNIRATLLRAKFQERVDTCHCRFLSGFPEGIVQLAMFNPNAQAGSTP
jgi:hypothetical protein